MKKYDTFAAQRRGILRKIRLLTWGLVAAAVLLAVGAGAFIAWFFQGAGFPFGVTWVVASLLLLGVPAAVSMRQRKKPDRPDSMRPDAP